MNLTFFYHYPWKSINRPPPGPEQPGFCCLHDFVCVCVFLIVDFDVFVVKSHLPLCLTLGKPGSQGKHIPGIARKTTPNSITLLCGRLCVCVSPILPSG